jgi:hypothetical protein
VKTTALDEKRRSAWNAALRQEILRGAMSEANVEIVRTYVDTWNSRDMARVRRG